MIGGTAVTITGSRLATTTTVNFGTTAAAFTIVDDSRIDATAPAHKLGTVKVQFTTGEGLSPKTPATVYQYLGPALSGVSPAAGPVAGGGTVTLTGSRLSVATQVMFGRIPATSFTIVDDSTIQAVAPPQDWARRVQVVVATAEGATAQTAASRYVYQGPAVTGVSPAMGPAAGGTVVTLTGSRLSGTSAVMFGATPAAAFTVVNDSTIRATSPARPAGTAHVLVTTAEGGSRATRADLFASQIPTIDALSPATGNLAGGTVVRIAGRGLLGTSSVLFGGTPAAFTEVDDHTLVAVSPAYAAAKVARIQVVTPSGANRNSAANRYTYSNNGPANRAPVPGTDRLSLDLRNTPSGSSFDLLGNDSDPDGDLLWASGSGIWTLDGSSEPAGNFSIDPDGTLHLDPGTNPIGPVQQLEDGQTATATLHYTVTDSATSAVGDITVLVTGRYDPLVQLCPMIWPSNVRLNFNDPNPTLFDARDCFRDPEYPQGLGFLDGIQHLWTATSTGTVPFNPAFSHSSAPRTFTVLNSEWGFDSTCTVELKVLSTRGKAPLTVSTEFIVTEVEQ